MKILLVVSNFVPEIGSTSHISYDLARAFAAHGHEVDVITSYPRRYTMDVSDRDQDVPTDEIIEGVHIHRCRHPSNRDRILVRGLEHFYLPLYYYRTFRQLKKKFDVCLMMLPPLPLYYLAKWIKHYDGTPFVLNIQDFHPQELTDVGFLTNPLAIRVLAHIERAAYTNADYLTVLSPGGVDYVVARGADPKRVSHIYNAVSLDSGTQIRIFKEKEGIEDKFLISYAGILSPFQGIDHILDVAKALQGHKDIVFFIVGDGMIRSHLEERIRTEEITNVRLRPFLPRDQYLDLVRSSDLSLISLDERMKAPCMPGKLISLLAAGQPVVTLVDPESETARVVREAGCGIVVDPCDIEGLKMAIIALKEDPAIASSFGGAGRSFFEGHMGPSVAVAAYKVVFEMFIKI
ncbi:glycosyltransferase WbuB [Methanofollis formosanus]|uniref:Glycosyltransferase WbuB n=1 Tax=Methanofollis formosanus TaxID=299308 RepID=A0A8G0ZY27_9EURY|nr:glycosyltransferase family 4 protein [Methanofollis formosanus]QYZ78454.1 glycosyltransferase WbuB [Methanofollis formosanus]